MSKLQIRTRPDSACAWLTAIHLSLLPALSYPALIYSFDSLPIIAVFFFPLLLFLKKKKKRVWLTHTHTKKNSMALKVWGFGTPLNPCCTQSQGLALSSPQFRPQWPHFTASGHAGIEWAPCLRWTQFKPWIRHPVALWPRDLSVLLPDLISFSEKRR